MKSFIEFITEREMPWKSHEPHWIGDHEDSDHIYLYHGTHRRNAASVEKHGVVHGDPSTGLVSHALDPHTARGYAAMSGAGGEANFRKTTGKAVHVPVEDRAVAVYKVPKEFVRKHMQGMRGNLEAERDKLTNKERFLKTKEEGKEHPYAKAEVRFKPEVSAEMHKKYYVGHMYKGKQ